MAESLILFPFRITASGRVAAADQFSDEYVRSQIEVIARTRIGEREMCLPFGTPDPAFSKLAPADIQTCLDQFGPDGITVTRVDENVDQAEFVDVVSIEWTRNS